MALRAGRGAQLLKAIEAKKKAKEEEARQIEEDAKKGIEHPRVTLSKGRAALLEQYRKSSGATSSDSGVGARSPVDPSVARVLPVNRSQTSFEAIDRLSSDSDCVLSSGSASTSPRLSTSSSPSSELARLSLNHNQSLRHDSIQTDIRHNESRSSDSRQNDSRLSDSRQSDSRHSVTSSAAQRPEPVVMKGTSGQPILLVANFLRLNIEEGRCIYEYNVKFSPPVDSMRERENLIHQLRDVLGERRERNFDCGASLYLPKLLPQKETILTAQSRDMGEAVQVKVTFIREKSFGDPECVQFFNVLFNKVMKVLKYVRMKQSYYDPQRIKEINHFKLEIWPGYVTHVEEKEGGLMLTCDVSHRVLRAETALDVLHDIRQSREPGSFHDRAKKALLGQVVLTKYNNTSYTIGDINFDAKPTDTFSCRGKDTSFLDYYRRQYGINQLDPNQPMLVSLAKKKLRQNDSGPDPLIMLIPQICFLTGLTDCQRKDFKVMKDVAEEMRLSPAARELQIRKFSENVANNPEALSLLTSWGIHLASGLVQIEGRVLPPITMNFGHKKEVIVQNGDFSREVKSQTPLTTKSVHRWFIVYDRNSAQAVENFLRMYRQVAQQLGIEWYPPSTKAQINNDRTESYLKAIKENTDRDVQFNITVFPTKRDDRYSAVKKLSFLELNTINQVIMKKTLERNKSDIVAKIALQINAKLGGELWASKAVYKNSMVVGVDVWHPKDRGQKSVAAIVCSLTPTYSRWYSKACKQESQTELMAGLQKNFVESLQEYQKLNNELPDRVIVFRDGVGDGRLEYTRNYEVPQLTSAFRAFGEDYTPKLTVVIVSKRINEKFMMFDPRSGNIVNPPPGTVVDHTVTRRNHFDFFIVSQSCNQGTAAPTHYLVLYNNAEMKPDQIQKLSYRLTYMYYNWPGSVRVPAPCLYADRLAGMVGQNLQNEPSKVLADKLYYI